MQPSIMLFIIKWPTWKCQRLQFSVRPLETGSRSIQWPKGPEINLWAWHNNGIGPLFHDSSTGDFTSSHREGEKEKDTGGLKKLSSVRGWTEQKKHTFLHLHGAQCALQSPTFTTHSYTNGRLPKDTSTAKIPTPKPLVTGGRHNVQKGAAAAWSE